MMTKESFSRYLDSQNVSYTLVEHPAAHTEDELDRLGVSRNGVIAKSLFLYDKKAKIFYLVMLRGNRTWSMKELQHRLSVEQLTQINEEQIKKKLENADSPGVLQTTGGDKVRVLIDKDLYGAPSVGFSLYQAGVTVFLPLTEMENIIRSHGNDVSYVDII